MKVAVTGSSGLIGTALAASLRSDGHQGRQARFTAALNTVVSRRDLPWLRGPGPVLQLGLGEASVELLTSSRVMPKRLAGAGYQFRYPALPEALSAELAAQAGHGVSR